MKWRDYDINLDRELDDWILESFSENVDLVNKYAFFNTPISKEYKWYQDHPLEMSNIADYFKIVEIEGVTVALFVFNYFRDDHERSVLGINPMTVHPKLINQGYGTHILSDLVANTEEIIGHKVDAITASIDEENIRSTKVFKKVGFKEVGITDDREFVYYEFGKYST